MGDQFHPARAERRRSAFPANRLQNFVRRKNLYVGVRAYDNEPDKIVRRVTRRDQFDGDWVEINIDQEIDFTKRVKRPPANMVNALIRFGNSMVYISCLAEIYRTQLNPLISYLHEPGTKRFSLSLDLAEIFKPLLADRLIFSPRSPDSSR